MTSGHNSVSEFWRWFLENAPRLEAAYRKGELGDFVNEVDARVARLEPGLRWEVGPFNDSGGVLFLGFGSAGDRERLRRNRAIVSAAPDIAGWVLLPAKPPKRWTRRRTQLKSASGERWVDFDRWGFTATETKAGIVVRFVAREVQEFDESELEGLGWTLLDWELGEEFVLDRISDVAMLSRLQDEQSMAELRPALLELAREDR